ncbi:SusC/RagA family TonB-linked outer membrane protein [Niabella hirudinis]|uniref:SusC/RagA family TonB-linked outer membrane protein n=1 Tax=Niabella hirudinis TaxID=1285929 RepID=UPI003EBB30C4
MVKIALGKPYFSKQTNVTKFLLPVLFLFLAANAFAQTKVTVVGAVVDSANTPLSGITVVVQGNEKTGTSTDPNGRFVLDVVPGATLVFSAVSYDNFLYKVPQTAEVNLKITLTQKAISTQDEVVVTALGRKQIKEAVVGSVTTIKPDNLRIPTSNLTNALVGQAAGIIGFQTSGQPGLDNSSFFIRGVTTFGYRVDPLILIDNIEVSNDELARLNVNDLESFTILKDASATSLYGARGANGVILVTTRTGKLGKARINFDLQQTISQPTQSIKLTDPITYMNMFNEATVTRDPTQARPFSADKIYNTQQTMQNAPGSNKYVYPAVDWLDMLFKKRTATQRANVNISGGSEFARYYISGSYSNDNGILKNSGQNTFDNNLKFTNYQLRTNIDFFLSKSSTLSANLWGVFNEYTGPITNNASFSTDLYDMATHSSPVLFPAYYEPDSANRLAQHILFGNAYGAAEGSVGYLNPYAQMLRGYKRFSNSNMTATIKLDQKLDKITPGLHFNGFVTVKRFSYFDNTLAYNPFYYTIGLDGYDRGSNTYNLTWINNRPSGNVFGGGLASGGGDGGAATEYLRFTPGTKNANAIVQFQGSLDYIKRMGDHEVGANLNVIRLQRIEANGINPSTGQSELPYALPYRNLTLAGEASYAYKTRYFLRFNFGYNGSERFDESHRYGFFPTIGASWIVSKEKFWENGIGDVITTLKLRSTIGYSGNDQIGSQRFFYQSDVNLAGGNPATFGLDNGYSRPGVTIRNYENKDVTWEKTLKTNNAIELSLFRKIDIVAEYWTEKRNSILQSRANIPSSAGLEASISANVGAVKASGWDLSANYKQAFGNHLYIDFMSNFTYSESLYENYEEPAYLSEPWRHRTGTVVGQQFGYIAERLFVDDKEAASSPTQVFGSGFRPMGGDIKYRDINRDGQITVADMVPIGLPNTPQISYGFGTATRYRSVDFSFRFQGNARTSLFINPGSISPFLYDGRTNSSTQVLQSIADDYWSESNQNMYALYPRLGTSFNQIANNLQPSSWWMRNGSFLRLKLVELGYTLPNNTARRLHLQSCRIYANGSNLWLYSNFKLWDIEQKNSDGTANGFIYPLQKTYNLGIMVTL